MTPSPLARILGVVCSGAALLVVAPVPSALAHPFGPPPVARLEAQGSTLTVSWAAQPDDYVSLGGALGVLAERQVFVYDAEGQLVQGPPPEEGDGRRLAASEELRTYLREHLAVRQDGIDCDVEVNTAELVTQGARYRVECPETVEEVEVELSLLTDLHPSYRTVASAESGAVPERALYTIEESAQLWTFGEDRTEASSRLPLVAGGTVAVGAAAVAGGALLRRRRRGQAGG